MPPGGVWRDEWAADSYPALRVGWGRVPCAVTGLDETLHPATSVVPVGPDGRFVLQDVDITHGLVVVGAEPSPGTLSLAIAEIEVDPDGPTSLPTLYMDLTAPSVLVHAPTGTGITTVVLTAETGSALIDAHLEVLSLGALSTDEEGQLRVAGLPPGRYVVRTSSPPASSTFRLDAVSSDPSEVWLQADP